MPAKISLTRAEHARQRFTKHGLSRTRTYRLWAGMKTRATNPNRADSKHYIGRGITVCERWKTFMNFLEDMGEAPDGLTLERIKNNGNYEKENCKWSTRKEQSRNNSNCRVFTVRGVTGCIVELCEHFGLRVGLVRKRIDAGWKPEDCFVPPTRVFHKFTSAEFLEIKDMHATGKSTMQGIADKFKTSRTTISSILSDKSCRQI